MQINQLTALASMNDADVMAVEQNNITYKATRAVLLADVYRKAEVYSKSEVDALIVPMATRISFGGSAANLYANLTTLISDMQKYEAKLILFQVNQADGIFTQYQVFVGTLTKIEEGSAFYASGLFSTQTGRTISIYAAEGTWNAKLVVS
jgi:hypothetical protein